MKSWSLKRDWDNRVVKMRGSLGFRYSTVLLALLLSVSPSFAQLVIKLRPETVSEFERYANGVEAELGRRWQGKANFTSVQDSQTDLQKVLAGEVLVRPSSPDGKPVTITDGLIHDWVGAVFIPDTEPESVIDILRNFDNHKKIYPEVADSKTISSHGSETVGYWRVQQRKGIVPVVLEVRQKAYYKRIAPGKWTCRAYARNITEIDKGMFIREHKYPEGEGHGYMWRMYAYWSIEAMNGGVLAECRMLSLSRSIPQAIAWAVGPYIQKAPQDSLTSTLKQTRAATANGDH